MFSWGLQFSRKIRSERVCVYVVGPGLILTGDSVVGVLCGAQ